MITSMCGLSGNTRPLARVLLACLVLACGCSEQAGNAARPIVLGGLTMGTTYSIKIHAPGLEIKQKQIHERIKLILDEVNASMSTYIEDSELSLLNHAAAGQAIPLSPDLFEVLQDALEINRLTNSAFDITVGPLVNLWGFGPEKSTKVPNPQDIDKALERSGRELLQLQDSPPGLNKRKDDIYIDLSGIAKGFAVDKIADYLTSEGIDNYLVEIGGEIRASGTNDIGFAWRVGIEQAESESRGVQRILALENIAMATSGDYRNYFEEGGVRYSHTIDPRSGYPIKHKLASVSVLHSKASWADALATGFLVLGTEAAWKIAESQDLAVLFIEKQESGFKESYTPALEAFLLRK